MQFDWLPVIQRFDVGNRGGALDTTLMQQHDYLATTYCTIFKNGNNSPTLCQFLHDKIILTNNFLKKTFARENAYC